jgi:hypothetical protein
MATSLVGPQRRDALRWRERVVEPGQRIRRSSIAAILPLVEDGLTRGDVDEVALAELQAAFADLRTALSAHSAALVVGGPGVVGDLTSC